MTTTVPNYGVPSVFVSDPGTVRRKLFENFSKRMEIAFFRGPEFLDGSRRVQKAESRSNMNVVVEGLKLQKMTKASSESGIPSDPTVRMVGGTVGFLTKLQKTVTRRFQLISFRRPKIIPVSPRPTYLFAGNKPLFPLSAIENSSRMTTFRDTAEYSNVTGRPTETSPPARCGPPRRSQLLCRR